MRASLRRWPDLLVGLLLVGVVLGPLLWGRGFVLVGDMVFVPDQPWKQAWTGGDGGVPRAVPSDAWISIVDEVVPGALLQRLVLVGLVGGAAWGMSQLLQGLSTPARLAGMVLYVWNPYVYERLAIGHWALLCGYAVLPFAVGAATRLRSPCALGAPAGWAVLAACLAVAGWTSPTGGVLVWGVVLVLLWGRWRTWAGALLLGLWVNLPWIVPAIANQRDQLAPDPFGVEAFAARPDTFLGTWGSLATFGGIWKESIVPSSRDSVLLVLVAAAVLVVALAGVVRERRRSPAPIGLLSLLGLGSLLLAGLSAMPATRPVLEWVVTSAPGGGLLRDSQKLLVPWVLLVSLGLALAVDAVVRSRARFGAHSLFWAAGLTLLPVLAFPSLAWGLNGFLSSTPYPDSWSEVRAEVDRLGVGEERVVVLPFATYRRFEWNQRSILDPVPRFFPGQMVTDDSLAVPEGQVGGESRLARSIAEAGGAAELTRVLADNDVRWMVVHGDLDEIDLPEGAVEVAGGDDLTWLSLPGPRTADGWTTRGVAYAILDLVVLLITTVLVLVSTWRSGISSRRRRHAYTEGTRN